MDTRMRPGACWSRLHYPAPGQRCRRSQARTLEAAQQLHGTAAIIRIVLLPDLPTKGDVSDWLDADPRRAEKLVEVCFDVPLWEPGEGYTVNTRTGEHATTAAHSVDGYVQVGR